MSRLPYKSLGVIPQRGFRHAAVVAWWWYGSWVEDGWKERKKERERMKTWICKEVGREGS